ncbi:RNA polymerase sigma factor [Desertivirga arenae]|uniref:RNA polymerase sigma factor n=1 Tax=Desertivirga arenae TaxID=2810309 RepID=UPI001A967F26|nr:sigma-70 family RNA polymerase sigma factor [Pedobacter sp. SYSU D00823]
MLEEYPDYHDDSLLLAEIRKDNTVAFDCLYDRYWEMVFAVVSRRTGDTESASDITQDIFLKIWAGRNSYKINNLKAYLLTSARNTVLNWMEKEGRYRPVDDLLLNLQEDDEQADAVILRKEFLYAYNALVSKLSPSQQEIFKMRYDQGHSTAEIALRLNISRKTVQNQLGKSVSQLQEQISLLSVLVFLIIF